MTLCPLSPTFPVTEMWGIFLPEHAGTSALQRQDGGGEVRTSSKKKRVGVAHFGARGSVLDTTHRIFKGWWHGWCAAHSVSVLNVNRNDRQWNANVNRLDNDNRWDAGNRLLLRNYFLSSPLYCGGVFFSRYVFQPANILLASISGGDICAYCLSVSSLIFHPTRRKNFTRSSLVIAVSSAVDFGVPPR